MSDTFRYAWDHVWNGDGLPARPAVPGPKTPEPPPAPAAAPAPGRPGSPGELTGRLLRHFRVGLRIASGGMGEVYEALDTALSRRVAIKVVRPELTRDATMRALLINEAQAQARVVHPSVAQVFFAGEDAGVCFIAMQLVEGGSLARPIAEGERFPWQDAARHMLAVAEGLAEAERLGIVHRDIKPANILVDRSGRACIADFGLACLTPKAAEARTGAPPASARAGSDLVMGTLEYVAPEQLRGESPDFRADMYSLGATFYHLLSGRAPHQPRTLQEAARDHARPRPRPLRTVAPWVPRSLTRIIDRCVEHDRERRFPSFGELIRALRRAAPVPELPGPFLARTVAWVFDLIPAALVLRFTYDTFPAAALITELALVTVSVVLLGASPGAWLLRLRLRTSSGGDPPVARAFLRVLVHAGWLLPLGLFLQETYASGHDADAWGMAAVGWFAVATLGSLGAPFGAGRTLHDRISGLRVLVDSR